MREEKSPALGITGSFVGPARMEPELVEDRSEDADAEDVEPVGQVLVRPSQTPDLKMGSQWKEEDHWTTILKVTSSSPSKKDWPTSLRAMNEIHF